MRVGLHSVGPPGQQNSFLHHCLLVWFPENRVRLIWEGILLIACRNGHEPAYEQKFMTNFGQFMVCKLKFVEVNFP